MTERPSNIKSNEAFEAFIDKSLETELHEKVHMRAWNWKDLRDIRNGTIAGVLATLIVTLAAVAIVLCQTFIDQPKKTQTPHDVPIENPIKEGPVPSVRQKQKDSWHVIDI